MSRDLDPLRDVLRSTWGYEEFRPLQAEAMQAVTGGRDSLVVMPTGGGKSLCFQAPAIAMEGTAIVISPLISLMKDQVDALNNCGVSAAFLNSTQTTAEQRTVREDYRAGRLKLLYLAPERIRSDSGYRMLADGPVSFFAIDEAHCVSLWGHDFRPDYRELQAIRDHFPKAAIHAYTATATERVREDIVEQLRLRNSHVLVGSFDRPNLSYRVERRGKDRGIDQIREVMQRYANDSGIVYCMSRKEVERLSDELNRMGFSTAPYHAGLDDRARKRNQDSFINDRVKTIVATVAFGMGIDKSNVRYVVHAALPSSLENYQQESGRAGRDGLPSECILLHSGSDVTAWQRMIDEQPEGLQPQSRSRLAKLLNYCETPTCRHRALVRYFGQELEEDCGSGCDVCAGDLEFVPEALVISQKILSSIHRQGQRYGAAYTAQVLIGSDDARIRQNGHESLSTYGLLKEHPEKTVISWVGQLAGQGYLERQGEYQTLAITEAGRRLLKGDASPKLTMPQKATKKRSGAAVEIPLDHPELFEELRSLRRSIADTRGVPPYVICGDVTLKDLARLRPSTVKSLTRVSGIGTHKQTVYGQLFVDCLLTWCKNHDVEMDVPDRAAPKAPPRSRSQSSHDAEAMFKEGLSLEEVSKSMGRAASTVLGYLTEYIADRRITDPSPWVDPDIRESIESAIPVVGTRPLKVLFEHLEGSVNYNALKIVVQCWENKAAAVSSQADA